MRPETPRLSQSIAKTLLQRSPLHAWHEHRLLGGRRRPATKAMDTGTCLHEMVLGGDRVVLCDFDSFRTKDARAARDAARDAGKVPMLRKDYDPLSELADRIVVAWCDAFGPLDDYRLERRLEWTADGVDCEGTPDGVGGTELIVDLKTVKEIGRPDTMARSFVSLGYDIQIAAYTEAVEILNPEAAGRVKFAWLVVETDFPCAIQVMEPEASMIELGRIRWERSKREWSRLLSNGWDAPWPLPKTVGIEAPEYAIKAEEMRL